MTRKKLVQKHIEKGRFYHFHEGSKSGHPGKVYWKNDNKNLYLAITVGTSNGSHRTKITPTSKNVQQSFVHSRPLLAKRKDIGSRRYDVEILKKDKDLIKAVIRRNYRESPSIKAKDRRYMKRKYKKQ